MKYSLNAVLKLFEMQSEVGFMASQIIIQKQDDYGFLNLNKFKAAINAKFEAVIENSSAKKELCDSLDQHLKLAEDIITMYYDLPTEPYYDYLSKLKYLIYCTPTNDINDPLQNVYLVNENGKTFLLDCPDNYQKKIEDEQFLFETSGYPLLKGFNRQDVEEAHMNFQFISPITVRKNVKNIKSFLEKIILSYGIRKADDQPIIPNKRKRQRGKENFVDYLTGIDKSKAPRLMEHLKRVFGNKSGGKNYAEMLCCLKYLKIIEYTSFGETSALHRSLVKEFGENKVGTRQNLILFWNDRWLEHGINKEEQKTMITPKIKISDVEIYFEGIRKAIE